MPFFLAVETKPQMRQTGVSGGIDRVLDVPQALDHALGPPLLLLLPQKGQFTQKVRVAEGVVAVILNVGSQKLWPARPWNSGRTAAAFMASRPRRLCAKYQVNRRVEAAQDRSGRDCNPGGRSPALIRTRAV